jgi:hypothetical protein
MFVFLAVNLKFCKYCCYLKKGAKLKPMLGWVAGQKNCGGMDRSKKVK